MGRFYGSFNRTTQDENKVWAMLEKTAQTRTLIYRKLPYLNYMSMLPRSALYSEERHRWTPRRWSKFHSWFR
jgi:hypothetical protein